MLKGRGQRSIDLSPCRLYRVQRSLPTPPKWSLGIVRVPSLFISYLLILMMLLGLSIVRPNVLAHCAHGKTDLLFSPDGGAANFPGKGFGQGQGKGREEAGPTATLLSWPNGIGPYQFSWPNMARTQGAISHDPKRAIPTSESWPWLEQVILAWANFIFFWKGVWILVFTGGLAGQKA